MFQPLASFVFRCVVAVERAAEMRWSSDTVEDRRRPTSRAPVILVRGSRGGGRNDRRSTRCMVLDLREGIDFGIWLNGSFEPSTRHAYEGIVSAGDQVIDVGANVGAGTMHLARAVGPTGRLSPSNRRSSHSRSSWATWS